MVNLILLILYLLLLLLVIVYSGIIVYHMLKYRHQLPITDAKKAMGMMWIYLLVSAVIFIFSAIAGLIYWFTT